MGPGAFNNLPDERGLKVFIFFCAVGVLSFALGIAAVFIYVASHLKWVS